MSEGETSDRARILMECLEATEREGPSALERACRLHPELATWLTEQVATARGLRAMSPTRERPAPPSPRAGWSRYALGAELGRGGMGIVYRAEDLELQRAVALKLLFAPPAAAGPALERFRTEARLLGQVAHPHIVRILDIGQTPEGTPFFTMDLVEGIGLDRLLEALRERRHESLRAADLLPAGGVFAPGERDQPPRTWTEAAARLLETFAEAVQAAHDSDVIHRDLKPGNVLVDAHGEPHLVDFGLARRPDSSHLTRPGGAPGTPAYMSPEQAAGDPRVGKAADVYGLGATLYHCLTLRQPFAGASGEHVLEQVRRREPESITRLNPDVPRDLRVICETAMAKEPSRRYASAGELAADLRRFLEFKTIRARPAAAPARAMRWVRRNPLAATAVLLAALVLVAIPVAFVLVQRESLRASQATALARLAEARAAAQRGNWRKALAAYDTALATGLVDPIDVAIGKIRALEGMADVTGAATELAALAARKDLGRHQGRVSLLQAELGVNRIMDPEAALPQVRAALSQGGLEPAEEEFARAMLAANARDALVHLAAARSFDPAHRGANEMHLDALFLLGRLNDAERVLDTQRSLYPEDPSLLFHLLALAKLRGDESGVRALAETLAERLGPDLTSAMLGILGTLDSISLIDEFEMRMLLQSENALAKSALFKVVPGLVQSAQSLARMRSTPKGVVFRLPPVFLKAYRPLVQAALGLILGGGDAGRERLDKALRNGIELLDEPMFHYFLGRSFDNKGQFAEAEKAYRAASVGTSLFIKPRTALFSLLYVRYEMLLLARRAGDEAGSRQAAARISEAIVEVLALPDLTADEYRFLLDHAIQAGVREPELEIAARWSRAAPKDPDAKLAMARTVFNLGDAARMARELAAEVLREHPDHVRARRYVEQVEEAVAGRDRAVDVVPAAASRPGK